MATGPDGAGSGRAAGPVTTATPATGAPGGETPRRRQRLVAGARRHWLFGLLFTVGGGLRLLLLYAYRPAFEFSGDSYAYLTLARMHQPDPMRPAGYPTLLGLLAHTDRLAVVPLVQHLAGLGIGVALYALLLRRRIHPAVAALAAAPVLLDAYQLDIEHFVMAETLFLALLVGALVALLWSPRPAPLACAAAGGLLAAAGLTRTLGVALGVLALGYLAIRRLGWLRLAAFALLFAAPLAAYASWYHSYHGQYALSGGDDAWLYGRVAPIADCAQLSLSPEQRILCSPHPPRDRPGPNYYVWADTSPRFQLTGTEDHRNELLGDFARQVIRHQPLDYARMVLAEVGHYFVPGRHTGYRDWPDGAWRFPDADTPHYFHISEPLLDFQEGHPARVVHEPAAGLLRGYQGFAYTPGPLLAVLVVLALTAVGLGLPRPRRPWPRQLWPRRPAAVDPPAETATDPPADAAAGAPADGRADAAVSMDARGTPPDPAPAGQAAGARSRGRWPRRAGRLARPAIQEPVLAERRRLGADCALLVALGLAVLVVPSATVCFDYRYMLPVLVLFPPAAALATRQFRLSDHGRAARR
ncbi:hypothetical protein [Frankia nepalensis]|nr:hypothetical protein [Frankia nepalensis]